MIAPLRRLWQRARNRGFVRGYASGLMDGPHSLPPELIAAYKAYLNAPYPSTERNELKEDFLELFDDFLEGEIE